MNSRLICRVSRLCVGFPYILVGLASIVFWRAKNTIQNRVMAHAKKQAHKLLELLQ
jgi:hypothetical protein